MTSGKLTTALYNTKDYEQALQRLELIFDAKKGTKEGDELEILGALIEDYEDKYFPLQASKKQ